MRNLILITLALLSLLTCDKSIGSELKLLKIFQMESNLVMQYQDDYVGYMRYQVDHFAQKNRESTKLIQQINKKYATLSEDEKNQYQRDWQKRFQPIIDKIYQKTRVMVLNEKSKLNPGKMTTIQELSIKMELLEKETPTVKLIPRFFVTPGQ